MNKCYVVRYKFHDSEVIYRETYTELLVALTVYEELESNLRRIECCMIEDGQGNVLASR